MDSQSDGDSDEFQIMDAGSRRQRRSAGEVSVQSISSTSSRERRARPANEDEEGRLVTFKIPVRKEQLCSDPGNEGTFFVQDRVNVANISEE